MRNKKLLSFTLAAVLAASVMLGSAGCGSSGSGADAGQQTSSSEQGQPDSGQSQADAEQDQGQPEGNKTQASLSGNYRFSGKSADEILADMTLDQKIWQMIQPAVYMTSPDVMKECDFGSILSKTDGSYLSSSEWKSLILEYQNAALSSEAGIPFIYGQDDVHGVNYCKGTVIYPHNIGLGAANDPDLMYEIGAATADEAKLTGMLWNFAPCVAVSTDPRWGRTYESYSSDAGIVGDLGVAYVKGLQDNGVSACGKHFFADGAESWGTGENGFLIDRGDADLSESEAGELLEVYRRLVDAGVRTIMISHGSVGGVKMHENGKYISVLRDELGFDGMIVSDWESIHNISGNNFSEQMANAINAGIDMLMEPSMYRETFDAVKQAVESGAISQERIDDAVRRILQFKIEAGVMDDPLQENVSTAQSQCGSQEYRQLAERAVEKSLVLIKNDGAVLPLKSGMTVYVTGPAADNIGAQCGGWTESWNGPAMPLEGATTIIEGLRKAAEEKGITVITDPSRASEADVTLLFIGERPYAEWNGDSADLSITGALALPENSSAIGEAENLRSSGIPTVACIVAGRNVIISDYLDKWDAAVMCYLPGSEGTGVGNVLTGKAQFTGKLPMPWYASVDQIGTSENMFPVGYGLGYDQSAGSAAAEEAGKETQSTEEAGEEAQSTEEAGNETQSTEVAVGTVSAEEETGEEAGAGETGLTGTFEDHKYTIVEEGMSWSDAEAYCKEHGGHLASSGSAQEQQFLEELAAVSSRSYVWIGGYRDQNGGWKWSDGTEYSYENWDENQPDNWSGNENYIRFTVRDIQYAEWTARKGKWNDTADDGDRDTPLSEAAFIMEEE